MKKLYLTAQQVSFLTLAIESYIVALKDDMIDIARDNPGAPFANTIGDLVEGNIQQGEMVLKELKKETTA